MIIWSRAGFLVVVALIVAFFLTGFIFDAITGIDNYSHGHGLPDILAFALAGIACWFLGRALNKPKGKIYIDPENGEEVIISSKKHTLFFIRIEYWGIILFIIAIINIFTSQPL